MTTSNRTFPGGYRFRKFEGQPQEKLIEMGIPEWVIIPIERAGDSVLPISVKAGDSVAAGQMIARDDASVSSPVHASVSGRVEEIRSLPYFGKETEAVIIRSDGRSQWRPVEGYAADWRNLPKGKLQDLLYLSGASGLGREGIPTRYRSAVLAPEQVKHVIVHGVGSQMYNLSLSVLLEGQRSSDFSEGLKILRSVMPEAHFHLAIDKHQKGVADRISKPLVGEEWIDLCALEPKYPQEFDAVLLQTVVGKQFPYGSSAAHVGVVVLDIQAVLQVFDAVTTGKPVIERIGALCGPGFTENPHVKVRIGTPLEAIVRGLVREGKDIRFVLNRPLTGAKFAEVGLPVDRHFSQVSAFPEGKTRDFLAFADPGFRKDSFSRMFPAKLFGFKKCADTNLHGEERPCIFCNFCQEVCPAGIIPHLLYRYVEKDLVEEAFLSLGAFNCIGCDLCTYVCPSKIPVAKFIKEGQEKLIREGFKPPSSSNLDLVEIENSCG
ncbi:MAG: 4Fe-4S dicluster domain-containing protein [Candidatus Latescibacterota bacterium]